MSSSSSSSSSNSIWYLAYGSNMNPLVLSKRRKVFPKESLPCKVPNYILNFDCKGIPYFEPSFASIEMINNNNNNKKNNKNNKNNLNYVELNGVVHLITKEEMWKIRLTEGGNGHDGLGYDLREVDVITYTGQKIKAFTLIDQDPGKWVGHPSRRYMNLIIDGAIESKLDSKYIEYLKTLPVYERRGYFQFFGATFCAGFAVLLFLPIFMFIITYRSILKTRPPRFVIISLNFARDSVHFVHDYFLQYLFGSGFLASKKNL